jgi:hemolysin III
MGNIGLGAVDSNVRSMDASRRNEAELDGEEVLQGVGTAEAEATPSWRGRLHQAAFFAAIPAGITLVALARDASAQLAVAIYSLSLVGLYGASAAYHRLAPSPQVRQWLKRLDHSMIFLLIAGTATPIGLLVLGKPWSIMLLTIVWGGALTGIVLKMARIEGFKVLTSMLYIGLGWAVVLVAPQLVRGVSAVGLSLIVAGGLLYTCGAIVLLRRKPNPAPATFGYHEIWHAMVIAASACHYLAVLLIVLPVRSAIH